ncbi:uncharacterized protein BDZ99DRAFT_484083 [Mytilinidion resinicola]|uniref:Uncharacterized protein n=1 Tax=Mytilinidion resinicola TaxID=574789 RepID=A0A6A6Z9U9_9PEZI|nr:uncharacterized protein BDZ99DRAFT_484083 [Mytilinidion resinicola]KAF2817055.1 hypothetical protein BDZ99DRAFT_484083 [Mytilinidion resinicola]
MSSWLHRKRKGELQELASQANLPDAGLLKDDLIAALETQLSQNQSTYSKNPAFSDYYKRTGSPLKRERPSPPDAGTAVVSKPRRRQTKLIDQEDSQEDSTPQKALTTRTPRTVSRITSAIDIPASPSQLANVAEQAGTAIDKKARDLWKFQKSRTEGVAEFLRENFSSVVAVQSFVLIVEAAGLQYNTLEWAHPKTPAIASLGLQSREFPFPNLWLLLTSDFWAPATLWSLTSILFPLVASYFVNLTLRSNTQHKTNKKTYTADPLTFNIVKALLAYTIYPLVTVAKVQGIPPVPVAEYVVPAWGPFSSDTVTTISKSVPGGPAGLLIGAGVGVLAAIYDAALKK